VAGRVNGLYWHTRPGAPAHDAAQKRALERAGYTVLDIWDYEVTSPGVLDARMREVLR
jgi:very-short-patch-repair endonuclease